MSYGVLALMILGTIIGGLLQNSVNTVLPNIMAEASVTVGQGQWLVSIFGLCLGIVVPLAAYFVRRFDMKSLFLVAMALFTVGTFLIAVAPDFAPMLIGRLLEGVGTGIMFPLIQVAVFQNYPRERWGTIMGVCGLAFGFAPNIGPTIAGIFAQAWGWRSIFWACGILSAAVTLAMLLLLPHMPGKGSAQRLDWPSVALSSIAFGGVLYGLTSATDEGFISAFCLVPLICGIACLVLFIVRQRRIPNPLWDLDAFHNRDFSVGTIMICLLFAAFISVTLVLPLGLMEVQGFSTLEAGMSLLPGALAALIMNPLSGIAMDRIGTRPVICLGAVLLLAGSIPMMQLGELNDLGYIMLLQGVRALGISTLIQPISTWSVRTLTGPLIPDGTAISNTLRQVAGSFGVSIAVLLMSIGGAVGSVSAFGVDLAIAFSTICTAILLALSLVYVRS